MAFDFYVIFHHLPCISNEAEKEAEVCDSRHLNIYNQLISTQFCNRRPLSKHCVYNFPKSLYQSGVMEYITRPLMPLHFNLKWSTCKWMPIKYEITCKLEDCFYTKRPKALDHRVNWLKHHIWYEPLYSRTHAELIHLKLNRIHGIREDWFIGFFESPSLLTLNWDLPQDI